MIKTEHHFGLTKRGLGVSCDEDGLFIANIPLLEKTQNYNGGEVWAVRALTFLNKELTSIYGLPVDLTSKINGLSTVANALSSGQMARAQTVALHLRLPNPPEVRKAQSHTAEARDIASRLIFGGILKADWDPDKHPRWPAQSAGGAGGEFAPTGASNNGTGPFKPTQLTIPLPPEPFEVPLPRLPNISPPSEIVPPAIIAPNADPRAAPQNPYPSRPDCVEEWASATRYCDNLRRRGLLGKGDYRGMGKTYGQCLRGQVSEECGGNSLRA